MKGLGQIFPTLSLYNTTHLWGRNPKLFAHASLRSTRSFGNPFANFKNLSFCQFCCDAFLSVLHSSMSPHVLLVFNVRRPSQIGYMIVRGVAIIMRDIVGIVRGRRKKGESN